MKEGDASAITAGGVGEGGGDTDHQSLEGDTSDRETWGDAGAGQKRDLLASTWDYASFDAVHFLSASPSFS